MFFGSFEHTLDEKGRVVLPSPFRAQLTSRAYVSMYDNCLGLWSEEEFAKVAESLDIQVRSGEISERAQRLFYAEAVEVRLDAQGRICISQKLRDLAGLSKDVVITGQFKRIEVWDRTRWNAQMQDSVGDLQSVTPRNLRQS